MSIFHILLQLLIKCSSTGAVTCQISRCKCVAYLALIYYLNYTQRKQSRLSRVVHSDQVLGVCFTFESDKLFEEELLISNDILPILIDL